MKPIVLINGHSYVSNLLKHFHKYDIVIDKALVKNGFCVFQDRPGKSVLELRKDFAALDVKPDVLVLEIGIVDLFWSALTPEQVALTVVSEATRRWPGGNPEVAVICLPTQVTRISGTVTSVEDLQGRISRYNRMLGHLTVDLPEVLLYEHNLGARWSRDLLHPSDQKVYSESLASAIELGMNRLTTI